MGEAYLHNHGGMSFGKITATLPVNQFIVGDSANNGTAVIYAHFGRDAVRLHPSECVFSPATVSAGTTSITISATINGVTRSCSLPVTVYNPSSSFGSNTWAQIAAAAYLGRAVDLWQAGDEKTETIDGTQHTIRILGFDHNSLAQGDEMYSDAYYNKGKGKAAIALQFKTSFAAVNMNDSLMKDMAAGWNASKLRTEILPALYALFPSALKNVVRQVETFCYDRASVSAASARSYTLQDRLTLIDEFIEACSYPYMYSAGNAVAAFFYHKYHDQVDNYELFEQSGYVGLTEKEWTRTFSWDSNSVGYMMRVIRQSSSSATDSESSYPYNPHIYRPIFNI